MKTSGSSLPSVTQDLVEIMQAINSVGQSYPLIALDLDFIKQMERESCTNDAYKSSLKQMRPQIKKLKGNIEDYSAAVEIKNIFYEVFLQEKLGEHVVVEKIPESDKKSPDFQVEYRGNRVFVELKSLNMLGGSAKHRTIMNDTMDAKIDAYDKLKQGLQIGFGETVISPYWSEKNKDHYDSRSIKIVIESLLEKIDQNIKEGQFQEGPTFLLIDLGQLPLLSLPEDALQQTYIDHETKSAISGELWHVAFGKVGDRLYRPADFEGADNDGGTLDREGILEGYPFIKGLVFYTDHRFFSVAKLKQITGPLRMFLEHISAQIKIR